MRILMYKWKAYNHIDVEGNLLIRGHEIDIIEEEIFNVEHQPSIEQKITDKLNSHSYDIFFSINYFPLISDICEQKGLPYVYWTCDSQITCMYHESIFNSCNVGFIFDYADYITFKDMGANVTYLPLAGAYERIQNILASDNNPLPANNEVSFIGSMYNKNLYDKAREHLPEYLKGYFDSALTIQQDLYTENIFQNILTSDIVYELQNIIAKNPSQRSLSSEALVFSTSVLGFKMAQLERKARLTSISKKCSLNVYTDDDNADFGLGTNKGSVNYWQDAPKIFRDSKININLTIKNIRTGIPLRIFDILSCGGFIITNFQPELPMYFENNKDLVWFTTVEEFEDKISYYLKHDTERNQIALNGMKKLQEQHTYQHRFNEMSQTIHGL